jgi:hypothetical protein
MPPRVDQRPGTLDSSGHDGRQVHALGLKLDLTTGDPTYVQQVIDQPDQGFDLSLDNIVGRGSPVEGLARSAGSGAKRCE